MRRADRAGKKKPVGPGTQRSWRSLRVGFVACNEEFAEKIILQKMVNSLTTSCLLYTSPSPRD